MKKTFEITKTLLMKIAVGALLLALIGATLTSCFSSSSSGSTVEITGVTASGEEGHLTSADLDKIATLVFNNTKAYEGFVAAYRGYDQIDIDENADKYKDESFEGVKDEDGKYVANVEAAKKILEKYDESKTLNYEALDASDIENIVLRLKSQTDVELVSERGFFENIQYWIGVALGAMTSTVGFGNYLVGICIFAIIVEILLLPLSIKQQKNSIRQAKLRPKEMAIRKRYAGRNDQATQQKIQQEIQDLYTRENFNPASGCLPLLIQLPIIMILYNIVIDPIKYVLGMSSGFSSALVKFFTTSKAAGGLGGTLGAKNGTIEVLSLIKEKGIDAFNGIKDFLFFNNSEAVCEKLSDMHGNIPSFNIGPINFGMTPSFSGNYWLLVVPVLTFVVYYFSMKLSKKFTYQSTLQDGQAQAMGCSGKIMDISMPLMSVFFTFIVPGAVGVYWIFKSIVGTVKQFVLSRVMPLPVFTEEDYKAAEKELNAKNPPKKNKGTGTGAKVRSLHHIDDDDYDQPTPAPKPKAVVKEDTPIEKAPIKEDTPKDSEKKGTRKKTGGKEKASDTAVSAEESVKPEEKTADKKDAPISTAEDNTAAESVTETSESKDSENK